MKKGGGGVEIHIYVYQIFVLIDIYGEGEVIIL